MAATLSNPTVISQIALDFVSGAISGSVNHREAPTIGSGTPSGSINLAITKDVLVATGTPLVIDLTAVDDPSGATISLSHFCGCLFKNQSGVTAEVFTVGGGTNAIISALPDVEPSGHIHQYNPTGKTVDSTHKNLQFTVASGTSVAGRLTILGRSV